MGIALGFYTNITSSTPYDIAGKVVRKIYAPVFSYLYNNPGIKFTMFQTSSAMRYIESIEAKEFDILIASLAKRGDLEILTGSCSDSILTLLSPKDRSLSIERMTTFIRKRYGVRADSCFLYGQVWSPSNVSAIINSGLSSVVISGYRKNIGDYFKGGSFTMDENGKRISVLRIDDSVARLVADYSVNDIEFSDLVSGIENIIERTEGDAVVFINLDQLLEGSALNHDNAASLFIDIFEKYGKDLVGLSSIKTDNPGYLEGGWYGRDAAKDSMTSFGELFVRNATFRYLVNRYRSVSSFASSYKRNKVIKRAMESALLDVPLGPIFMMDVLSPMVRDRERRNYWKNLLQVEWEAADTDGAPVPMESDIEGMGYDDFIARNNNLIAVFSPLGGSVIEFSWRKAGMNLFDSRKGFDSSFPVEDIERSFTDEIITDRGSFELSGKMYTMDVIHKVRGDVHFMYEEDSEFSIMKMYRLRAQTLGMETIITADRDISGKYIVTVNLESSEFSLISGDQRKSLMLGNLDGVGTVRYAVPKSKFQLSFSSTEAFSLTEERNSDIYGSSEKGLLDLSMKIHFTFPLNLKKGESEVIKLLARVSG